MKTVRLTLRFTLCVLGLVVLPVMALVCVAVWAVTGEREGFNEILRPWFRHLRHPFTE